MLRRLNAVHWPPMGQKWTKDDVGRLGEALAAKYLRKQGCKLLKRNYRARQGGEADLVLRDRDALVFLEVKTRSERSEIHRPRDAVDWKKRRLIKRASASWRRMLKEEVCYRYDIMEVYLVPGERPELQWIKEAFPERD
jgi:putative endonuclease